MSNEFSTEVTLKTDERGYLGRECPGDECLGYFLIRPGTGRDGENLPMHCPYCGKQDSTDVFHTPEQIAYAQSVALRQITAGFLRDLKKHEFNYPANGPLGIGISMKLTPGNPFPIQHYRERALETEVTCDICTLGYAVYGVFGFCPDCGTHNSLQMLNLNLALTRRQVALADTQDDPTLQRYLLEGALANCVSALDGFGREHLRAHAARSNAPTRCAAATFQNLEKANRFVQQLFGIDLKGALPDEVWEAAERGFMKRHLVAHRSGVVDQAYLAQTGDREAVVGRKVPLNSAEVVATTTAVLQIGRALVRLIAAKPVNP